MSTFEADIWTPGLQSTKAKQSKDTEREWDAGTGPGTAAGSNGATSGVRMGRKSSVSSTASSDEGHGHSVSATLRNSIAGINMKRLGSNRSNKSGKSGPASKDASILYRIFHPGGSSAEPVFGRSRRTYNSGSESEFDSDDSEASVDSNASNLSIGNSNSNMGLSLNPVSRSPMASNQSQGQNKNALRSSVPRISSTKEITSLFDPRAKSKKAPAAVDSESESEAEVDVRKASRPSIFKELLMHKPYSSTTAPANANQQPKKVISNAPPSAAGSMRALSRSASDDSGDNTSDTDHHSVSSHSSNIFKSIMNGKRKPSVSASAKSASVGLGAKPAAKPVPSKETSTGAAAVKPPSSNSSNTITTTLSASPEAAPGVLASVALPATNANFLSPGVGGGDGKRSNSSGSHTSLDRVGSDLSINEKYGVSGYDKIIGRGASAVVRLCSPINSDKKYAIKEFRSRRKDEKQKDYVKKLIAEFCISSTLDHENIIKTVDLIQDDRKKWCVVMEYAEGGDLYAKIHTGLLTDPDVIDCFFKQLLSGVSYLHSMGVAHRDLKPENLLLDAACRIIKITDFGVSEVFRAPFESHTKKGHGMCGSGPYIAPEEFTQKEYDSELVDVWACGIIYYVMLYNSIPWKSASPSDSRYKHYQEHRGNFWPIDRLAQAKRRLMYRLLDPDPTQRVPMKEENLKLRLVLRKVADRRVPLSHLNHDFIEGAALNLHQRKEGSSLNASSALLPAPEELIIRWQKKAMSPKERGDKKEKRTSSKTAEITKLEGSNTPVTVGSQGGMFLFTYIDSDDFVDEEDLHRHLTTAKTEDVTEMAKRVLTLTKPLLLPITPHEPQSESLPNGITGNPVHLYKPLRDLNFSVMHLMAYLFSEVGSDSDHLTMKSYEKRLCTIKCYDSGLVTMTPGFNSETSVYQFQINEDVYQYRIELISKDLNPEDEENEWKIYSEYYNRRVSSKQAMLPTTFQRPPSEPGLRLIIMGEISSVQNFFGETIYIHYLVDLAEGWSVEGGQLPLLSAYTQCSSGSFNKELHAWEAIFSFPLEAELISLKGCKPTIPNGPAFISRSAPWTVGTGIQSLGCYDLSVPTWKPVTSPYAQMKSLLVGGSAELDDITYDAVPFGHTGPKLNKYGFQTETSGSIRVKLNLTHQQGKQGTAVDSDAIKELDPTQFVKNNAYSIAEAISRAKERLQAIRATKKTQ
ncbi:hypothetical protein CcCBS67573_g00462 [Chytriomyces confervae]|uniref:non-specific serine/threonine protein kinase n=1 Tax=Chytriomyces confervae TaxID=246404 RepID=A0A507FPQ0_9FUNG|nr:hypothetical protein CcCBS67573_g00462 [Chytriomyces confervae]